MSKGRRQRPRHLPKKLRQIRMVLGLSQNGMIKRLGLTRQITQDYVSAYERGVREPPLPILLKYARVAKVSTDLLIDDALELPAKLLSAGKQTRRARPSATRSR